MSNSSKPTAYVLPVSLAVTAYYAVRAVLAGYGLNLVGGPLTAQDHRLLAGGAITGLMAYVSPIVIAKVIGAIKSATGGAATPAAPAVPGIPGGNMVGSLIGQLISQGQVSTYIEAALGLAGSGMAAQVERIMQAVAAYGRPVSVNCVFSWGPGREFPVTYNVGPVAPAPAPSPAAPAPAPAAPLPSPAAPVAPLAPVSPFPGQSIPLQ